MSLRRKLARAGQKESVSALRELLKESLVREHQMAQQYYELKRAASEVEREAEEKATEHAAIRAKLEAEVDAYKSEAASHRDALEALMVKIDRLESTLRAVGHR